MCVALLCCCILCCLLFLGFSYFCSVFLPSVLWYCCLLTCKTGLPDNLYCVGGDVKPCSINEVGTVGVYQMFAGWLTYHSLSASDLVRSLALLSDELSHVMWSCVCVSNTCHMRWTYGQWVTKKSAVLCMFWSEDCDKCFWCVEKVINTCWSVREWIIASGVVTMCVCTQRMHIV